MKKVLIIDDNDFSKPLFGSGGATNMASAIRNISFDIYIVGATSDNDAIGIWRIIKLYGKTINFLPVIHKTKLKNTCLKSEQLVFGTALIKHLPQIKEVNIESVLLRSYFILWLLSLDHFFGNICFYYPGLGNPMLIGRKPKIGRFLAPIYDIIQGFAIRKTKVVFAAASQKAVDEYNLFLKRIGTRTQVVALPTSVDMNTFRPQPQNKARKALSIPVSAKVYTYVGRLAKVKGIPLIFNALSELIKIYPDTRLLLVGDGEEKINLVRMAHDLNIEQNIVFCGLQQPRNVAIHISAADVCVVGSYVEGFSQAMIEQLACGKPIVSTNVSGAKELIKYGKNGFIVYERNAELFATKMIEAFNIKDTATQISLSIASKYSERVLWRRIEKEWLNW